MKTEHNFRVSNVNISDLWLPCVQTEGCEENDREQVNNIVDCLTASLYSS